MKLIAVFLIVTALSGCATFYTPPSPISSPVTEGKVAILVDVSDNPTHTHIGTTVFNNFSKTYDYSWGLQEDIYNMLENNIEAYTELDVIKLTDIGINTPKEVPPLVSISEKQWVLNQKSAEFGELLASNGVVAIIVIHEKPSIVDIECSSGGCIDRYSQGQGVYSRSFLGINKFLTAPSYNIRIEAIAPPVNLSKLKSFNELSNSLGSPISRHNKPKNLKNITESEFEPIRKAILSRMESMSIAIANVFNGQDPSIAQAP